MPGKKVQTSYRIMLLLPFIALICLLLATVFNGFGPSSSQPQSEKPQPAAVVTMIRTTPTPTQYDPDELLKRKLAAQDSFETALAQTVYAYGPTRNPFQRDPTKEALLMPTPKPSPTPRTGILNVQQGFPPESVLIENRWQNRVNGEWIYVLAGCPLNGQKPVDYSQGALEVVKGTPPEQIPVVDLYFTPIKAGSIKIIEEKNLKFTLLAKNGTLFYFDLPSRQFVNG